MDVLLTHGYFLDEDPVEREINRPYPPLGLLYLSAYLKTQGVHPTLFDSTFAKPSALRAHITQNKPDVVGFYVNMMTRRHVLPLIEACKAVGSTVVLGGPEPTTYADQYLRAGADVIVVGEGELTFTELLKHLDIHGARNLEGLRGIQFADTSGRVVTTGAREKIKQLDDLPFPDRDAIDIEHYMDHWKRHHGVSSISLITARGCPYTCRWCSHAVYGFSYRTRSPQHVADEVEHIRQHYNPDQIWYADDVFTINKKWIAAYAGELAARGLHIPFETISREDRLDDDVIANLSEMGCYRMWVGAESGSQHVLDAMDRRTSAERTREVIGKLKEQGIRAGTFIMFGYTGERWSDLNETYEHLTACLPDDVLTTAAYPIKGTAYFEEVEDRVIAKVPWHESSDRELQVRGGKTPLFYRCTARWMQAGLRLCRELKSGNPSLPSMAKAVALMIGGRIGMLLTWRLSVR